VAGALLLAACAQKNIENKDAIRQAVLEYLSSKQAQTGLDVSAMDVDVTAMAFERDTARATVLFKVKNGDGGMQMNYTLDRKGDKWVVRPNYRRRCWPLAWQFPPMTIPGAGKLPPGIRRCVREPETMKTVAVLGGGPPVLRPRNVWLALV